MLTGLGACASAGSSTPAPTPAPTPPAVVVPAEVTPVAPALVRYTIPALVTDARYRLQSVTELERDSAGRRDTREISADAQVLLRMRRRPNGDLSGTGRVFSYVVKSGLSTTPIAIDSLRFDAVLDSLALRVAMQPPLVNECDRPESGALSLVRDLLLRVPASLAVGQQWRDSTVQLVCRSSIPMLVRTVASYVVTDSASGVEGVEVVIQRTSTSHIEGKASSPWRMMEVAGTGSGTLTARVSVRTGAVSRFEGTSALTLTLTDRTSPAAITTQSVTQRVKLTGSAIGN
jgi:hypothetical protein